MTRSKHKQCGKFFSDKKEQCPRRETLRNKPQRIQSRCGSQFVPRKRLVLFGCASLLLCVACLAYVCYKPAGKTPLPISERNVTISDPFHPKTLNELLALSPEQLEKVDIARINLLCAVGLRGSENLDVEACIRTLDVWAYHVDRETKRNSYHFIERPHEFNNSLAYYRMGMMGTVLIQDIQIQYNPELERKQQNENLEAQSVQERDKSHSDSRNKFLHGLLSDRHYGTCASMPFLYAAIGRRLGYNVNVAARKNHLYARYEDEDGSHLNIEATENQGFSTPTDEEYRNMGSPMTDEEIEEMGWLKPLSNKEVLGICLVIRSICLRSMKRYDDHIAALGQAAQYLHDSPMQRRFLQKNKMLVKDLQDVQQVRRVRLPEKEVPVEYRQSIPVELMNRLRKLTREKDMLVEMQMYATEESQIRILQARDAVNAHQPAPAFPPGQQSQVKIRPQDLPQPWRGREIPPELQARLASLNTINDQWIRKSQIDNEISSFFIEQDQREQALKVIQMRRGLLDQEVPFIGPPIQIEIVRSAPNSNISAKQPNSSGLLLTSESE